MPIKVRVQDFQSIEDATIVIDGFTVITGPNNSGKTALMRAIRGLFTNAAPGPLVRHGAAHLTVTIEFDDGNVVVWKKGWSKPDQKGGTVNQYILNGKDLGSVGSGVPDEVAALGVNLITAGGQKMWPQMAEQFGGVLFLVNNTGSVVAEAVADVDKVGKLSGALKLSESDRRSVASTLKVRRKDALDLEVELAHFEGLEDMTSILDAIDEKATQLEADRKELSWHQSQWEAWAEWGAEVEQLAPIEDVTLPMDPTAVQETRGELHQVVTLSNRLAKSQAVVKALEGITSVEVPEDTPFKEVEKARELCGQLRKLRVQHKAVLVELETLSGAAEVAKNIQLDSDLSKMPKFKAAINRVLDLQVRLGKARAEVSKLEVLHTTKEGELASSEIQVQELLAELGVCPTCHQETGEAHVH